MNLNHFNKSKEIKDNSYVWRYMSYFKLYDFLFNRNIYFSRLDNFSDPLEGLDMKTRFLLHLKNTTKDSVDSDPLRQLVHSENTALLKEELEKWQKGIFASCWFLTEDKHGESLAMWELYSNQNGFVIKIPLDLFNKLIDKSLNNLKDFPIVEANFGKIEYLDYHEQPELNERSLIMPALVKHHSYSHENEIRYLLLWDAEKKHNTNFINLNFSDYFNEVKDLLEVISHPNMDNTLFDLYFQKFKEIQIELKKSKLLTKEIFSTLIK
jgi:hypothetical protein